MSSIAVPRGRAAAALLFALATALPAQTQPNSAAASLLINGQSGTVPVMQGEILTAVLGGGAFLPALHFAGQASVPPIDSSAGWLHVYPFDLFLVDGTTDPSGITDAAGQVVRTYQVPWLAPLGLSVHTQGAVQDLASPAGFTLTAPASITVGATLVVPEHLFFDPTLGALGVDSILPPAGTLPGDLPTLDPYGFPGPTQVFFGSQPVHTTFQSPFTCHICHGNVQEIWPRYQGTMMANAVRDPLFDAQFAISVAGMEMLQNAGASPHGGELAADFCIRCHSPVGWQGGRSGFTGDGVFEAYAPGVVDADYGLDQEGVSCDVCHRATGFVPAASPSAFVTPGLPENAQLVFSPVGTKRGPFPGTTTTTYPNGATAYGAHVPPELVTAEPNVPHNPPLQEGTAVSPFHDTEQSAFHGGSALCGSCHNITSPVSGHAIERTYSEWLDSDFGDPVSPDFETCQGCHMPPIQNAQACTLSGVDSVYGAYDKVRGQIREHAFVGGNAWIPQVLKLLYPQVDQPWTTGMNFAGEYYNGPASRNLEYDATTLAAYQMMKSAAEVDLTASEAVPGTITAQVTITNLTGHKLPTGYPEGRQMWIRLTAEDAGGQAFYSSGLLDVNSGLVRDPDIKVYEAQHGLNYPALGLTGPSFHFALNNVVVKDNRILPKGFVQTKGIGGTDSYDPALAPWPLGGLYPDGQHWDTTTYAIAVPPGTARPIKVKATVLYQTASLEYLTFLAMGGDATVQTLPHQDALDLLSLWLSGTPAPAMPVGTVGPSSTQDPSSPTPDQSALVIIP